jgi:hypothetical protein
LRGRDELFRNDNQPRPLLSLARVRTGSSATGSNSGSPPSDPCSALCFTEDDIRQKFAVEERWGWLSEAEHREAIQSLLDAGEYEHAGTVANDAIADAVVRYLDDAFLEKTERQAVGGFTW